MPYILALDLRCHFLIELQYNIIWVIRRGTQVRLKGHAWKACVLETVPWVRIPSSPPFPWPVFCVQLSMDRVLRNMDLQTPSGPEGSSGKAFSVCAAVIPSHI